ncbi:hypothetical protein QQF64_020163 [Cirrhinus molitorella]|uniref:Uncharacterized protein n=1 Tax=Cirrhinus molitorella TaxID=172907 RepID=A0ABR3L8H6_9TELE
MKDEEIKALRDRMMKMESIIPAVQQDDDDDDDDDDESVDLPANGVQGRDDEQDGCGTLEHLPKEERVSRLMEEDPAFRRGRMRWLKQEQMRLHNLQQQQITKRLRRGGGAAGGEGVVHLPGTGRFIPPQDCKLKFPFKSNPQHRLSWGPNASVTLDNFKDERNEGRGPVPCVPLPLLPLPFQVPVVMRTPSPSRAWQPRQYGNGNYGNGNPFPQQQQQQWRYRRNSLDGSTVPGNQGYYSNGHHNNTGRGRYRRQSPGPCARGEGSYGQAYVNHQRPTYQNYQTLPHAFVDHGNGRNQKPQGYVTPPRMRRQYSAPDLKSKETPV